MAEETVTKDKKSWFKRHKILTTILALIVLGIVVSASGGNKSKDTAATSNANQSSSSSKKAAELAKMNTPVRDGKFEFTVTGVDCGKTSVGSQYVNKSAQGQFCMVNMSVKNIGDKAQTLSADDQKLFNAAGQEYSADSTATIYAASDPSNSWYSEINPGNTVQGSFVFDIPKDQSPVMAELHDSALSSGIKVSLQ